jgi:hypothetical protein
MAPRHEEGWHGEPPVPRSSFLRVLHDLRGRRRIRSLEPPRARRPRRGERRLRMAGPSESCETNPISAAGGTAGLPGDQECETNPIGGVSSVKFEVSSGEPAPQTHHIPHHSTIPTRLGPSERRNVQNEPNLVRGGRCRRDGKRKTNPICTHGKGSVGQAPPYRWTPLRQTNPIWPGRASIGGEMCETNPISGPRTAGSAGQACETKPIWRTRNGSQVLDRK